MDFLSRSGLLEFNFTKKSGRRILLELNFSKSLSKKSLDYNFLKIGGEG